MIQSRKPKETTKGRYLIQQLWIWSRNICSKSYRWGSTAGLDNSRSRLQPNDRKFQNRQEPSRRQVVAGKWNDAYHVSINSVSD